VGKLVKKAVKLTAAATVALSAYAAVNPIQSEAATTAESLVIKAESNKVLLFRAISVDYNADAVTQPWTIYNKAKTDYAAAKSAVSKTSGTQREVLSARLAEVKLWIDRTAAYIDAISSGKKLTALQTTLETHLNNGDMPEAVLAYHKLSYEIKKQAIILYRVYGKSTREAILAKYKLPAEAAKREALYPVSIQIELGRLETALDKEDYEAAETHMLNIEEWLYEVEGDLLDILETSYIDLLMAYAPAIEEIALVDGFELTTGNVDVNAFDAFLFIDSEGVALDIDPFDYGLVIEDDKGYFNPDGSLTEAFAETGIPTEGKVTIKLVDEYMDEVIFEEEINIVKAN
jgi:hypothetical protein